MRRPSARVPRAPVATVWLSPKRNAVNILAEVEEHARRGRRVHVMRAGGDRFEILLNETQWLIRSPTGGAVGTFADLREAIAAGDLWLDGAGPVDFDDDEPSPRGAA